MDIFGEDDGLDSSQFLEHFLTKETMAKKRAVLLINLGSPNSTSIEDVRRYLREFLMDPRVMDLPEWKRCLLVNLCILPFRPKKTAQAYKKIWQPNGSPLILISQELQKHLNDRLDITVELAMRYGIPTIKHTIKYLKKQGVQELYIIPLYPHYAMSSYETARVAAMEAVAKYTPYMKTKVLMPFYNDPAYIDALVESAKDYLQENTYDHLLFSFHGIPGSHLQKTDPSHAHCLCVTHCCQMKSPSHATCYRHQCFETVRAFVEKAGIPQEKYSISFQSRLGKNPWLEPYTDKVLEKFPKKGIKHLKVICPSFVADCLETLEEISIAGKFSFIEAGGESFEQIPCLNTHPAWINYLVNKIETWQ